MKCINTGPLTNSQTISVKDLVFFIQESNPKLTDIQDFIESALLVKCLRHENILPVIGVAFPPPKDYPLIVLPLMVNGDLKSLLGRQDMVSMMKIQPGRSSLFTSCLINLFFKYEFFLNKQGLAEVFSRTE